VVNGPAIGGGAELAAFGDLVIATPRARFAQPEISIGIFPPLASTILPFSRRTKDCARTRSDRRAGHCRARAGTRHVNRLVPEAQLEHAVKDLVDRISGHSGPVLTMAKKAILGGMACHCARGSNIP